MKDILPAYKHEQGTQTHSFLPDRSNERHPARYIVNGFEFP